MMKNEKQAYMAPTTDILELRVESNILDLSGGFDPNNWDSGTDDWFTE